MYTKFDGAIVEDHAAIMTNKVPSPEFVADILETLFNNAQKLEKVHEGLMTPYKSENDYYAVLQDISDALDEIDTEDITSARDTYLTSTIYSKGERWISSGLITLLNPNIEELSALLQIQNLVNDCEYVSSERLQVLAADIYYAVSSMYFEIYNTYDIQDWVDYKNGDGFLIKAITRGFNEFLMRTNKSMDEMVDTLYEKTQKFVYVTNEVDRDPEVAKKIRAMVPNELAEEFESCIELITKEQVEDILNRKIAITQNFLDMLNDGEGVD